MLKKDRMVCDMAGYDIEFFIGGLVAALPWAIGVATFCISTLLDRSNNMGDAPTEITDYEGSEVKFY